MPATRLLRILGLLGDGGAGGSRLCEVAAEAVGVTGAGLMLLSHDLPVGSVCTTDAVSARIEDLQYTLGEGPCVDAHRLGRAVTEPDLAGLGPGRWPAFTGPAVDAGARAVFGFPTTVGGARLGALNLYRDQPGGLTDDQHADALVMAEVAARAVLALQSEASAGNLAGDIEAEGEFRFVVHQAAGMVSEQLHISVTEALVRLRAHAFRRGRTLADVANDVVARSLRFDEMGGDDR